MPHPKTAIQPLTVAHKHLTARLRVTKKTLMGLLESGSRDYEVLQDLLDEYVSLQHGADVISGQAPATR